MDATCRLFTIGHSNHTTNEFITTLKHHGITTLVDVRSQPYSQWAHQFNREILKHDLEAAGIDYVYMGEVLGGRPSDHTLYVPGQERPDYNRMSETPAYQAGIQQLISLARRQTLTIMCSEGDHHQCHRHLLITQTLLGKGVTVRHIQPDGTCTTGTLEPEQLTLFGRAL